MTTIKRSRRAPATKAARGAAATAARALLQDMLKANPRAPESWRTVATALASDDAVPVWHALGGDADTVRAVADMARQSYEQAGQEMVRPAEESQERDDINSIIDRLKKLRTDIKTSSLPGNSADFGSHALEGAGLPPVVLEFGWHSLHGGTGIGYPLAVCDVLEWAEQMARKHLDRLPPRAVKRRKKQPELAAFVRYLAWHFVREFGKEHRGALAAIAQAIFDPAEPVTKDTINGILKDAPPQFKAPT